MAKSISVNKDTPLQCLLIYADQVETKEGKTYYRLPVWFEQEGDWFRVHGKDLPEDLGRFIVKAGLGNPNPQIKRADI